MTLGYLKDLLAVFGFAILIAITLCINDMLTLKIFVISFFIIGFIIDGLFSIYPRLHCFQINKFKRN